MEAVFSRDGGSLFSPDPPSKSFYCPTTPIQIHQQAPPTDIAIHQQAPPTDIAKRKKTTHPQTSHWDVVPVTMATTESLLSSSGSSKFNESWPSHSEITMEICEGSTRGGGLSELRGETLAKYVNRFRKAPPTDRTSRETPSHSFWWKQDHAINSKNRVTPPKSPQEHSTPQNDSRAASHTDPSYKVSTLVQQDPRSNDDSLDARSQEVIDKSSSLLSTCSSLSSAPAQKYLNSHQPVRTRAGPVSDHPPIASRLFPDSTSKLQPEAGPPDDILYQWRLKRRLELARQEAAMVASEGQRFEPASRWAVRETRPSSVPRSSDQSHREAGARHTCKDSLPGCEGGGRRQCSCGCGLQQQERSSAYQTMASSSSNHCTSELGAHTLGTPSLRPLPHKEQSQPNHCASQPHSMEPPPSQPHSMEPPPSQPHSMEPPPSQPHSMEPPPSQPHSMEPPPSQPHSMEPPPSQPHDMEPPPSQPHSMEPPPSHPHSMEPPPSHPHGRPAVESEISDDINMSDFSLDFTMEIDHAHHTNGRQQDIKSVVREVVGDHLFGGESLPHASTPRTADIDTDIPLSPVEPTSKEECLKEEALPWDCHMDDELLKCLIRRAQLFEEQIKTIDSALAALS